jgi:hypothetical protein
MSDTGADARLVLASGGLSEYQIAVPARADRATEFAASELRRYLEAISGASLPIRPAPGLALVAALALAHDDENAAGLLARAPAPNKPDGFRLLSTSAGVSLVGQRPWATLYAVYALFQRLGCRWLGPGDDFIHRLATVELGPLDVKEAPSFPHRDVFEDVTHLALEEPALRQRQVVDGTCQLDWMAKLRLSGLYYFRWDPFDPCLDDVLGQVERRDLEMVGGGHIIKFLLPQALFAEHPEYFRMDPSGRRVSDGNFSVSSDEALRIVCGNAVRLVRSRPHIGMRHVWGDVVVGSSWCSCDRCRELTVQDQYLTACNAIAHSL